MKRALFTLCAMTLGIQFALAAEPAQVDIVAFESGAPLAQVAVFVDDLGRGTTNDEGAAHLVLDPGKHVIVLRRGETELLRYELNVVEGESDELIVTIKPDGTAEVALESSHQGKVVGTAGPETPSGPPGTLAGRVVDSETKKPVIGARVFVSGTPVDARTNENGEYDITLSPGTYSVSVVAADYSTQTIDLIEVKSEQESGKDIELTPSGLDLPEFIVLEPYVEGSLAAFVEEKRTSSAVTDILGAEQISRAGDSDAAGALKRVTGLTLVDGKFVYVRGLGERYSSVLLNGAQIPSPDPTRRVVPLDLFPTEILEGIVIQKTFSADMPAEFGGGTVQLRTKGFPEAFFVKLSADLGYLDGTTFEDGLAYEGGGRDWTGYDDGARELPGSIADAIEGGAIIRQRTPFNPGGFTAEELEVFGDDLAGVWDIEREQIDPNVGMAFSIGNGYEVEDWKFGFLGALRYAQKWDTQEEIRRRFQVIGSEDDPQLDLQSEINRVNTERNVELGVFLNLGAEFGENHRIKTTTTLVRQTFDEAQIDEGFTEAGSDPSRFFEIEWEEDELLSNQISGEHAFPQVWSLGFNWQYTTATATREAPFRRDYRYDFISSTGEFEWARRADSNGVRFEDLEDESDDLLLGFELPFALGDASSLKILWGGQSLDRQRISAIRRFNFTDVGTPEPLDLYQNPSLEDILNDENIDPDGFQLVEGTRAEDNYTADQKLDAYYLTADLNLRDTFRVTAGARRERNDQVVNTFELEGGRPPVVSALDESDLLPSVGLTWWHSENGQLRFGYAETLNRPDFRELSPSSFSDPILDIETIGNPDLKTAAIKNYDVRWEYYFSGTESVSVAYFLKDFTNPIETVKVPGTGDLQSFANAESATNQGIELDAYVTLGFTDRWKWLERLGNRVGGWENWYVNTNYAYIDSEVTLGAANEIQTSSVRPLQGQSPYVINFQVGYIDPKAKVEASLLYNRFGERISQVGVFGAPDIYEQPFDQLDAIFKYQFAEDWTAKMRLRNLLDPVAEFTQGDEVTREFKKGREVIFTLEWRPTP